MNGYQLTPEADNDLIEIWLFISKDSLESADRVIDRLTAAFEMLAHHPKVGAERSDLGNHLRSFKEGHYLIVYRISSTGIEVVRVLHTARDSKRIFGKD